jgi:hypothetical protein
MTHRIVLEGEVLIIEVEGVWDLPAATAAQAEAGALARERGLTRVLVDLVRAIPEVDAIGVIEFTPTHMKAFPPGTRHALVVPGPFSDDPELRFTETVAENRCLFMRSFPDRAGAFVWLREEGPMRSPRPAP